MRSRVLIDANVVLWTEDVLAEARYRLRKNLVTSDEKFARCAAHQDCDQWPFEVHTPDSFLLLVDDSNPVVMRNIAMYQYEYWIKRPCGGRPLSTALAEAGAERFAHRVAAYIHERTEF